MTNHPFHLVDASPWPMTGSCGAFFLVSGLAGWFHRFDRYLRIIGLVLILMTMVQWWRDVCREATFQGKHTYKVEGGLRIGMLLFITSEVCFFFAFFWAFFHSSLRPGIEGGTVWPPVGLLAIDPFEVPLLNTTVLLSRGATITWAHMSVMSSKWLEAHIRFAMTIGLGLLFSALQAMEYAFCSFAMSDSVYGSTFFVATGFHGLHVVIGTLFVRVIWGRHLIAHFSGEHHFGFEASAWYWHFVDVVWLFLFVCVYWWGV